MVKKEPVYHKAMKLKNKYDSDQEDILNAGDINLVTVHFRSAATISILSNSTIPDTFNTDLCFE